MTLQNLNKLLDKYDRQLGSNCTITEQQLKLKGLPFYAGWHELCEVESLQNCAHQIFSFNHAVGLPQKNGIDYPLFDYEKLVYDTPQNHKHVWIKKATGLGITEFMLRYMAWLCLKNNSL